MHPRYTRENIEKMLKQWVTWREEGTYPNALGYPKHGSGFSPSTRGGIPGTVVPLHFQRDKEMERLHAAIQQLPWHVRAIVVQRSRKHSVQFLSVAFGCSHTTICKTYAGGVEEIVRKMNGKT